ncbi:MAG: RHS repeat-associated core domain-containing protein [Phycisphaerae bacterium]|nr:RHS repeat-associated core domain-containing protein [Phycisphaerae bacterium]
MSEYVHDGYNRLVSTTDPMGNVTTYQYDANGNCVAERVDGELTDVPGPAGNVRLYEQASAYDEMDRVVLEEVEFFDTETQAPVSDGKSSTTTEWSDISGVLRLSNDNDHARLATYDTANRLTVLTDAKGNTVTFGYDANTNLTSITEVALSDLGDPSELFTTTYTYDGLNRRIQSTDNVGNTSEFAYDSRGNQTATLDPLSHETRFAYDGLDRLIQTVRDMDGDGADPQDPSDIVTSQSWDDTSRLVAQSDDNGNTTTYAYDPLDRMVAEIRADGTEHSYEYDAHGNRTRIEDANGSISTCTYDLLDRLSDKTIAPAAGVSTDTTFETYQYDGLSRVVHAADDDALVTRAYDSLSSLTRETLNGQTTLSDYDGVGNMVQQTYPGGRTITGTHDELERNKTTTDGATGLIAAFDYVGTDRVARCDLGNGTRTEYTYDGITGVPNPPDDFGVKRIIQKRHTRVADSAVLDDRVFTWDRMYNKTRRADVRTGGPRLTHDYGYDAFYRLRHTLVTEGDGGVLRDQTYDLDGVGNRTHVAGEPGAGPYWRDPELPEPADEQVNQYTSTPTDGRVYDRNGNLTSISCMDTDDFARLSACLHGPGVVDDGCLRFDFDNDLDVDLVDFARFQLLFGVTAGAAEIQYDYRNRMVAYLDEFSGQRHTYAYDAFGRRLARVVDADGTPTETRYFYDGGQVIEEQDQNGDTQATYVYGRYIDDVLTMRRDVDGDETPEDYYYHSDDLYSVMLVSDAAGQPLERYEYADYGAPTRVGLSVVNNTPEQPLTWGWETSVGGNNFSAYRVDDGPWQAAGGDYAFTLLTDRSAIGNPYLFTGRRYDPETGWYYYRTRYLDPVAGRFTTRDAIGLWGDPLNLGNGYTLVGNNPLTRLDPFGLDENDQEDEAEAAQRVSDEVNETAKSTDNGSTKKTEKAAEDDIVERAKKGFEDVALGEIIAAIIEKGLGKGASGSYSIAGEGMNALCVLKELYGLFPILQINKLDRLVNYLTMKGTGGANWRVWSTEAIAVKAFRDKAHEGKATVGEVSEFLAKYSETVAKKAVKKAKKEAKKAKKQVEKVKKRSRKNMGKPIPQDVIDQWKEATEKRRAAEKTLQEAEKHLEKVKGYP